MKGLQDVADFWRREMSMRMQVSDIWFMILCW
jgi:hypothetical protein